jgi:leucyl aminopeptidase
MEFKISQKPTKKDRVYIIDSAAGLKQITGLSKDQQAFAKAAFDKDQSSATINLYDCYIFIYFLKAKKTDWQTKEACRKGGAEICAAANKLKLTEVTIEDLSATADAAYLLAEGMTLANYQFLKYRSDAKKTANTLTAIHFSKSSITVKELDQLSVITTAISRVRYHG